MPISPILSRVPFSRTPGPESTLGKQTGSNVEIPNNIWKPGIKTGVGCLMPICPFRPRVCSLPPGALPNRVRAAWTFDATSSLIKFWLPPVITVCACVTFLRWLVAARVAPTTKPISAVSSRSRPPEAGRCSRPNSRKIAFDAYSRSVKTTFTRFAWRFALNHSAWAKICTEGLQRHLLQTITSKQSHWLPSLANVRQSLKPSHRVKLTCGAPFTT